MVMEHGGTERRARAGTITKVFDGAGGARDVGAESFAAFRAAPGSQAFAWLHLMRDHPDAAERLAEIGLDEFVVGALTAEETRPRCSVHGDGVLLNLRGVNPHPAAEPGDMISIRLWVEAQRIVGVSVRAQSALEDMLAAMDRGHAPRSPGEFVANLALRLADRAEPEVTDLTDMIDDIEETLLAEEDAAPRAELAQARRVAILLRRYLVPQKDALLALELEELSWLGERDRAHLREAADRVVRLGEELDAIRDRAQIVHEQLIDQRAESLNRRMLLLTVVAAIFLPLSLLTGLLGMNVGGIPGAQDPRGFVAVCVLLVALGCAVFLVFRKTGMFR
ncbi:zinc transporter ZntB [Salipiger mucosus]|uniref:Magnesium and cobalt transport protein CorA n=1 Tax=Salipiger mucosus DSM 16094 TaxID=1123237 RepID=S9QR81_9RHOB|nr:zinc transporter ZntB [Salipiger mucosus]EPX82147.1 Magnesium and cobalt transport protein CorA [Salipiger mucosus DSM 16094]